MGASGLLVPPAEDQSRWIILARPVHFILCNQLLALFKRRRFRKLRPVKMNQRACLRSQAVRLAALSGHAS